MKRQDFHRGWLFLAKAAVDWNRHCRQGFGARSGPSRLHHGKQRGKVNLALFYKSFELEDMSMKSIVRSVYVVVKFKATESWIDFTC